MSWLCLRTLSTYVHQAIARAQSPAAAATTVERSTSCLTRIAPYYRATILGAWSSLNNEPILGAAYAGGVHSDPGRGVCGFRANFMHNLSEIGGDSSPQTPRYRVPIHALDSSRSVYFHPRIDWGLIKVGR